MTAHHHHHHSNNNNGTVLDIQDVFSTDSGNDGIVYPIIKTIKLSNHDVRNYFLFSYSG
jgi:hypothetical protein